MSYTYVNFELEKQIQEARDLLTQYEYHLKTTTSIYDNLKRLSVRLGNIFRNGNPPPSGVVDIVDKWIADHREELEKDEWFSWDINAIDDKELKDFVVQCYYTQDTEHADTKAVHCFLLWDYPPTFEQYLETIFG